MARKARSWHPTRRKGARRAQAGRCGAARCYLEPKALKYPVCGRGSCTPSCQGALAAYRRARQQHAQGTAGKALRLGKRLKCGWALRHGGAR